MLRYTILQLNPRVSESLELKSKMSPIPAPTHIWDLPGDRILLIIINTNYSITWAGPRYVQELLIVTSYYSISGLRDTALHCAHVFIGLLAC